MSRISNVAKQVRMVLSADVPNVGLQGSLVTVAAGYARNYLVPSRLAAYATRSRMDEASADTKKQQEEARRRALEEASNKLSKARLSIKRHAPSGNALHGQVSAADIARQLKLRLGVGSLSLLEEPLKVDLEEPIKTLGVHMVKVEYEGRPANVTVEVVKR
jgi:large subunit ribosomal protein L9